MVNNNIQGPIPLAGQGHAINFEYDYAPGRYKQLVNAEISREGNLINRRPLKATDTTRTPTTNASGIMGSNDSHAIVAGTANNEHWAYAVDNTSSDIQCWSPTSLPVDASAGSYHQIVGYFKYNGWHYWITVELVGSSSTVKIHLYRGSSMASSFASLTDTVILTLTEPSYSVKTFFIQGDRLWLAFEDTIYFSKATDPTIFAAPDGGFFRFPDEEVLSGCAIRENIYITTNVNIHLLTYQDDPNVDAYLRKIVDRGAKASCIFKDQPYFADDYSVFTVSGGGVEPVVPSYINFPEGSNTAYDIKLVPFADYIVLIQRVRWTYGGDSSVLWDEIAYYWEQFVIPPPSDFNQALRSPYNVHFINLDTGSVHAVYYEDQQPLGSSTKDNTGLIVDVHPVGTSLGILTSAHISGDWSTSDEVRKSYFYHMLADHHHSSLSDHMFRSDGVLRTARQKTLIEIEGFAPDGTEYQVKKFRNIFIEGLFPPGQFLFNWTVNRDREYPDARARSLTYNRSDDFNSEHHDIRSRPVRLGINQRGRNLNILFHLDWVYWGEFGWSSSFQDEQYQFEVNDVRVLWTYLGRHVGSTSYWASHD